MPDKRDPTRRPAKCGRCNGGGTIVVWHKTVKKYVTVPCPRCGGSGERQ